MTVTIKLIDVKGRWTFDLRMQYLDIDDRVRVMNFQGLEWHLAKLGLNDVAIRNIVDHVLEQDYIQFDLAATVAA